MNTFQMMGRSGLFSLALLSVLCFVGQLSTVHAAITIGGNNNVSPALPWTSGTTGDVGNTNTSGTATLQVDSGSALLSSKCYIGNSAGTSGMVTITGAGSTWTGSGSPYTTYVGYSGTGTLAVSSGGTATFAHALGVAYNSGASGTVTVDGTDGSGNPSTLTSSAGNLTLGESGNTLAVLNISNGGVVHEVAPTSATTFRAQARPRCRWTEQTG